jgi:hypothetical protein
MIKKKIKYTRYFLRGNRELLQKIAQTLKYKLQEPTKFKDGYTSKGRKVKEVVLNEVAGKRAASHIYLAALAEKKRIQIWCICHYRIWQMSRKRILLNKK